jgi:hypothetical protein
VTDGDHRAARELIAHRARRKRQSEQRPGRPEECIPDLLQLCSLRTLGRARLREQPLCEPGVLRECDHFASRLRDPESGQHRE